MGTIIFKHLLRDQSPRDSVKRMLCPYSGHKTVFLNGQVHDGTVVTLKLVRDGGLPIGQPAALLP